MKRLFSAVSMLWAMRGLINAGRTCDSVNYRFWQEFIAAVKAEWRQRA